VGCRHEVRWLHNSPLRMTHSYERFGPAKLQRPAADLGLIPQFQPAGAKRFSTSTPPPGLCAVGTAAILSRRSSCRPQAAAACLTPCELRDTQLQERFAGLLSEFVADKLPMPK